VNAVTHVAGCGPALPATSRWPLYSSDWLKPTVPERAVLIPMRELVGDRAVAHDRLAARPADQRAAVEGGENIGDQAGDDQRDQLSPARARGLRCP